MLLKVFTFGLVRTASRNPRCALRAPVPSVTVTDRSNPEAGETVVFENTLKVFQYMDPGTPKAFPSEPTERCRVRLFERSVTVTEGTGARNAHRGFRLAVLTSPKVKTRERFWCAGIHILENLECILKYYSLTCLRMKTVLRFLGVLDDIPKSLEIIFLERDIQLESSGEFHLHRIGPYLPIHILPSRPLLGQQQYAMPCALTIVRERADWYVFAAITSQSQLINILIQSDRKLELTQTCTNMLP
jgi:hypothetical protein